MIGLFGATGFTGRLTARWLARNTELPVVLAGRDAGRLAEVASALGRPVQTVVVGLEDADALRELASSCDVLLSAAGPFVQLGPPLVRAAVEGCCHYVDITGEAAFVRWSRLHYDAPARRAGLHIVHAAGFDALPHDVGAWSTVRALPDSGPIHIQGYVQTGRGKPSGGTWRSAMRALGEGLPTLSDPRVCSHLHRHDGAFAVPLPTIDAPLVLQTADLLGYGNRLRYGHHARVQRVSTLVGGGIAVAAIALAARSPRLNRWLVDRMPPGSGPDEAMRAQGWMRATYVGRCGEARATTTVRTERDAGYTTTAAWLGTCGVLLASGAGDRCGVVTPVAALGEALLERLPATGTHVRTVTDRAAGG